MEVPDAPTEAGTERDGVLSYATEWHALIVGLAAGFVAMATGTEVFLVVVAGAALSVEAGRVSGPTSKVKALGEVRREPWYALGGLLIGAAVGGAVAVV